MPNNTILVVESDGRAAGPARPSVMAVPLLPAVRSGRYLGLPRPAARALAGHDLAPQEELAAPDAPGLIPLDRTGQAGQPARAGPAERLRVLHVIRGLGEEQLRVRGTGQPLAGRRRGHGGRGRQDG